MISITRLVTLAAAAFTLATLCSAQENVKATNLGKGAEFKGKKIEMKDKGEVAYVLSFTAGKEFEATTDGTKDTDVNLYVYDEAGKEVGKDDSPGPKSSVKVTPAKDGKYKFVIKNAGGGQHGDLRGKGRQVMTRRLSQTPENSSDSLVPRITPSTPAL
jgi:hypothetical protein